MFYARQVVQSFFLAVYILQARTHVDVFARVTVFARKRQGGGPKVKSKNTLRSKLFNDNDRYVIYGAYTVVVSCAVFIYTTSHAMRLRTPPFSEALRFP